jgi:N-sulfoglucosamine sulfohydrolase
VKRQLKQQVRRELRAQGDPRMFGKGYIFDQYQYSNPEQKDFYERFMCGENVWAVWVNESDFEIGPVK